MITRASQTQNHLPLQHRLEPIREGLVCCRKIHDFGPMTQRQVHHVGLKPKQLNYVIAQRMGLLAKLKADPPFKSP
jgi:hypothetical protein